MIPYFMHPSLTAENATKNKLKKQKMLTFLNGLNWPKMHIRLSSIIIPQLLLHFSVLIVLNRLIVMILQPITSYQYCLAFIPWQ